MLTPSVPAVENGKVFMVLRGEIDGRLDCFVNYARKFNSIQSSYPTKKLISLVKTFSGGTPDKSNPKYWNGSINWVSPKDFGEIEIYTSEDTISEEGLINSSSKLVSIDSLLVVVRSGILQHTLPVAINKKEVAINQDIKALIIKDEKISPYYLAYFLKIFQNKILSFVVKHSTTVQSVNTEEFENLQIPIPPLEIQQQIVQKMEAAYASKRAKEAEAASLLASIDGYLLEQLGVTLPEVTEKKKVFFVCSDKVSGGRLDPKLYLPSTRGLIDCLFSTKYQYKPLKHLITHSVSGDWGIENFEEGFEECLVIRATEFDNRYNLRLENSRVKYRFIAKTKLKKLDIQPNDLLIEKSGGSIDQPVGRIAILTKELTQGHKLAFSNFVHKIRLSADVNSDFAYFYLNTLHSVKVTDVMQSQTNGIRNLIMKEYFNLPIPLPSIEIQTNIAAHITAIRSQAQQLETEAKAAVEAAKKEVEAIILGEGGGSA